MIGTIPLFSLSILLIITAVLGVGVTPEAAEREEFIPFFTVNLDRAPYISMVDLAETYRIDVTYDPVTLTMSLSRGAQRISVSNLSAAVKFNSSPVNLGRPARLIRGAMYVPAQTFLPILSRMLRTTFTWDPRKNGIISPIAVSTITTITFEERAQGTLIRISLTEPLAYRHELSQYNWLTIVFSEGSLSRSIGISAPPSGIVLDSRFLQRQGEAQLSFHISEDMESYDISKAGDSNDILISLRRKRPLAVATPPPTSPRAIEDAIDSIIPKPVEPTFNEDEWRIDTVVIDPGHGGRDSGAVGAKGTKEKDVVFAVAKELKKLCDERGELDAIMTRTNDTFVGLYQRAAIAKRANGKLFVSIHSNASKSRDARGMEVFFLSAAKTEDARIVAERENASVAYEDNPAASRRMLNGSNLLTDIERDMASNVFLKESQDLCTVLIDTAVPMTRQDNRGIKQAGFYVLAGTFSSMPSILFEIGFISNSAEERMLNRISYQKRLALAIYDAIIKFKSRHERGLFSRSP
jgi:N-acetylmuramoyl-L-alanine amidase